MLIALDINCLIRDLVKTTVQARDPLLGGGGQVRDQESQVKGGMGM